MRNLVLWGHSLSDYQKMFDLTSQELALPLLECNSGPTSFNAEVTHQGGQVVSVDEFYQNDLPSLKTKITQNFEQHLSAIARHEDIFVWGDYGSLDRLAESRRAGLDKFYQDFEAGELAGRYCPIQDPLPYPDDHFGIALMSHGILADESPEAFDKDLNLVRELARVAKEVRIFPLLNREAKISSNVGPMMLALQQHDIEVEVRAVPYHLQKSDNAMLRIWSTACEL